MLSSHHAYVHPSRGKDTQAARIENAKKNAADPCTRREGVRACLDQRRCLRADPLLDLLPESMMQPVCHADQDARVAICAKDLDAIAQSKAGVHHNDWTIVGREITQVHNGRASEALH